MTDTAHALIVIDVQRAFVAGPSAVPGDEVVISAAADQAGFGASA